MSQVSHSAAASIAAVFNTVSTSANAVSTTMLAIGNLAEELNLRSGERLHNVREDIKHDRIFTDTTRRKNHVMRLAKSLEESDIELQRNPNLAKYFEAANAVYASLDKSNVKDNSNS